MHIFSIVKKLAILLAVFAFVSCQKEVKVENPAPCPPAPVAKSKAEILVQKAWRVDEVARNISGLNSRYVRGGVNTTGTNYDGMTLTFRADGSGTYIDEVGTSHTVNWQFTTADQRNLSLSIGPPFPASFTWNMVEITEIALHCTTIVGSGTVVAARYTPVP